MFIVHYQICSFSVCEDCNIEYPGECPDHPFTVMYDTHVSIFDKNMCCFGIITDLYVLIIVTIVTIVTIVHDITMAI